MKHLKKTVSLILAFMIALMPASVYASETEKTNDAINLGL